MGGQVCKAFCKRQAESGDALDAQARSLKLEPAAPLQEPTMQQVASEPLVGTPAQAPAPVTVETSSPAVAAEAPARACSGLESGEAVPAAVEAPSTPVAEASQNKEPAKPARSMSVAVKPTPSFLKPQETSYQKPATSPTSRTEYRAARLAVAALETAPPAEKARAWVACEAAWAEAVALDPGN
mmetsp:Transcript_2393/g.5531  ORF Transcript_2393/g.5531 Transcript_2393/m.5531 type:complete len:184 (-) Transcript_2393:97-648(-)